MVIADEVNYCPRCGTSLVTKDFAGRDRPTCPACKWIFFPDPKVAAAVLVEQEEGILLVRRVNDPHQGLWTLPAGFVDAGEDPARAAERECLEETGLMAQVTGLFDIVAGQEHPNGAHFVIIYEAEIQAGKIQPGDDADRVGFFEPHALPPLAFEATKKVLGTY